MKVRIVSLAVRADGVRYAELELPSGRLHLELDADEADKMAKGGAIGQFGELTFNLKWSAEP